MTSSTDASRPARSSRPRAPRTARPPSARVRLARTIRWATVDSGDQERPRDLVGGQAAEQAQRQRHPGLGRQHRVAGGEDQAQQVVVDVARRAAASRSASAASPAGVQVAAELGELALERARCGGSGRSPGACRRPSARRPGCGHARLGHCSSAATSASWASSSASPTSRTSRARPAISRGRLDPPDRLDGPVRLCLRLRHGARSEQAPRRQRKRTTAAAARSARAPVPLGRAPPG